MVSVIYKQNMYSGVFDGLDPTETPVNLFEQDLKLSQKYSLIKPSYINEAVVKAGGCLYIPAYYWYQSETQKGEHDKTEEDA